MTDHTALVQRLHQEQPPISGDLASCFAFALRVLAALPTSERWGLLESGGENLADYRGRSVKVGRICDPGGQLVKLLTDIPSTNAPEWDVEDPIDPSRYVAFVREAPPVDPPSVDPSPVPPPIVPIAIIADIVATLARIEQKVDALALQADRNTEQIQTQIHQVVKDAEATLKTLAPILEKLGRFL